MAKNKRKLSIKFHRLLRKMESLPDKILKTDISAQDTIPYKVMYSDGICKVSDSLYTKTIAFSDINYHLLDNSDKKEILEKYCSLLNYVDSSVSVQLSFFNMNADLRIYKNIVSLPLKNDCFDNIRKEYSDMLCLQLLKGNFKRPLKRYITFGITEKNKNTATLKLKSIEKDILNNLKSFGVPAKPLNGKDRLYILNSLFNNDTSLGFEWDLIKNTGLTTKDFIAPSFFEFKNSKSFSTPNFYGSVSLIKIQASELSDEFLSELLSLDMLISVNIHIKNIEQSEAVKKVKRTITDLDKMKIDEQKKAIRTGYDMDILPSELNTSADNAKQLLSDLTEHNEKLFEFTVLVMNKAETKKQLQNDILTVKGIVQKYNCTLVPLDYRQEEGLMSSVPLGFNYTGIKRDMTSSGISIFTPFHTKELFFNDKEALYYGLNTLSNNMIRLNRKNLKNPNGIILGTPGSGKSFLAKREMTNVFLATDDDIFICDHENEYTALTELFGGQVITLTPTALSFLNPMEMCLDDESVKNRIALKSDFILSLCELIIGGNDGLKPIEKSVIDRSVKNIYNRFLESAKPNNMPILEDLYNELLCQSEPEAKHIASSLELYVHGSLNLFNHRSNVDLTNRLICFDIKGLGNQLKKIGMLIVQDCVLNRVYQNRSLGKSTRYYIDEFHLLLKDKQTASYSAEIWKRFRKHGGIPTGITQNVKDLLKSNEIENIFENSDFICMLNQASGDREILKKKLNISDRQLKYVTNSDEGSGLIFYGDTILPFTDKFPHYFTLYKYMTTKPSEIIID